MTSIAPTQPSSYTHTESGISNATPVSGDNSFLQMLLTQTASSGPTSSANSDSSGISGMLDMLGLGNSADTSSIASLLGGASDGMASESAEEASFFNGGPLPAFLNQVGSSLHLTTEQRQAMHDIAWKYHNADDTPDTVASIGAELTQAGITAA